jgi:hypothetical protein
MLPGRQRFNTIEYTSQAAGVPAGFSPISPASRTARQVLLAQRRRERASLAYATQGQEQSDDGLDRKAGFNQVNSWYAKRKAKIMERDDRMRQQRADDLQRVTTLQDAYNMQREKIESTWTCFCDGSPPCAFKIG